MSPTRSDRRERFPVLHRTDPWSTVIATATWTPVPAGGTGRCPCPGRHRHPARWRRRPGPGTRTSRSEERRVGKECRTQGAEHQRTKKKRAGTTEEDSTKEV